MYRIVFNASEIGLKTVQRNFKSALEKNMYCKSLITTVETSCKLNPSRAVYHTTYYVRRLIPYDTYPGIDYVIQYY